MIIRLIIFCVSLLLLPILIFIAVVLALVFYILLKLKIIQTPFSVFTKMNNIQDTMAQKKSFGESALRQFSCKHQNLEQQKDILICSDCGKIV